MQIKRVIVIFLTVLVFVPIVYVLLSIFTGHMKFFIVLSESMVPIMLVGDGIIVEHENIEDIKVGDIIAFNLDQKVVSHRVINKYNKGNDITFQTKGDNVEDKDPFIVESKDVIGKAIFKIPYIGYLTKFSKKPILFLIFTIIPSVIIIVDEIRKITRSPIQIMRMERNEKKRKKKEDIAKIKINYKRIVIIISACTIILFIINAPYIDPEFWINFSDAPYLSSIVSFIVIQSSTLLIFSSIWLQNRYNRSYNRDSIREQKRKLNKTLFAIRKAIY